MKNRKLPVRAAFFRIRIVYGVWYSVFEFEVCLNRNSYLFLD